MDNVEIIKPQIGYQEMALASPADIVIGGGSAGCFDKDTLIKTITGYKPISEIKPNERVLSLNTNTNTLSWKKVIETYQNGEIDGIRNMIQFTLKDNTIIKCTTNHEFYYDNKWVSALELYKMHKQEVISPVGLFYVCKNYTHSAFSILIQNIKEAVLYIHTGFTYDLCVEDNHNYCITDNNIVVHNSGKSFVLLLEPLRNIHVKNFGGVIFRRTTPMIKAEGGLWDGAFKIYSKIRGAVPIDSRNEWRFDNNVRIKFSHMEHRNNMYDWQGSEVTFIGFDELTHFEKEMFFYMLTRNRSTCGVQPYIRATCNPDPDSWVAEFIAWWIGEDGYPIPERRGVIRYFTIIGGKYVWGDTVEEVMDKGGKTLSDIVEKGGVRPRDIIKSLTFIGGTIYENKALLKADPGYLGSLSAQDEKNKARLLHGNWKVKVSGDDIYDFYKFADIFTNEHVLKELESNKIRLQTLESRRKHYGLSTEEEKEALELAHLTRKRITSDIALQGSDKFVVYVWEGKMLIDFICLDKSTGTSVIANIKGLAMKYGIPNSEIVYDNDGVGGFVGGTGGFIDGAVEFKNGSRPIGGELYNHLKSQCYFKSGSSVFNSEYYIPDHVIYQGHRIDIACRLVDEDTTLADRLKYERKSIKRGKPDEDGRLQVIKKSEMKIYLDNQSPDFMDAFMMREYFELGKTETQETSDEQVKNINW